MQAVTTQRGVGSLARIRVGESSEIQRILFASLRELCHRLGIHEGDVVRCQASGPSALILRLGDGRTVTLERDHARFIQAIPAD